MQHALAELYTAVACSSITSGGTSRSAPPAIIPCVFKFLTSTAIFAEMSAGDKPLQAMTPTKASYPFNDPSADIILRTPDFIEFNVHGNMLSFASPVFSSMLSLPQPEDGSRAQRPVIDVSEDSQVLDRLLRLCYPILKPKLSELEHIVPVLKAASKYEMEWPVFLLSKDLLAVTPPMPLRAWAAACRTGFEDVAWEAASQIRGRDPPRMASGPLVEASPEPPRFGRGALTQLQLLEEVDNLQNISAGDYFRLFEFLRLPETPSASFRLLSPSTSSIVERQSPSPQRSVSDPPAVFIPRISSPDVLLQCRDSDVQHRAHGVVLALHSAVLGEQFAQAKADWSTRSIADDGKCSDSVQLPIIHLNVTSDTLVSLLTACYDGLDSIPSSNSLAALASMLIASRELDMPHINSLVISRWEDVGKQHPLEAYFIATQYDLHDQARAAARKVVEEHGPLAERYVPHMEDSPALSYHHLLVYYDACVRAVEEQLDKGIADWKSLTRNTSIARGTFDVRTSTSQAMVAYLQGVKDHAMSQGPGRGSEVTICKLLQKPGREADSESFWPSRVSTQCETVIDGIVQMGTSLPKAITDAIAQVRGLLSWSYGEIIKARFSGRARTIGSHLRTSRVTFDTGSVVRYSYARVYRDREYVGQTIKLGRTLLTCSGGRACAVQVSAHE